LPVAALPFNDIKVNFNFKALVDLLVIYPGINQIGGVRVATINDIKVFQQTSKTPTLQDPQVFSHYAVVHNDERVKMGDAPRDILIHQVQETQVTQVISATAMQSYDLRLSHAIVSIFFVYQNYTTVGDWSNYTTTLDVLPPSSGNSSLPGVDPILSSKLLYENTARYDMGSDYFSLIVPYYFSDAIPEDTGYHMITYALAAWSLDPNGSTNYSKLANVSIQHLPSPGMTAAMSGINILDGTNISWADTAGALISPYPQKFQHVLNVRNHNIGRVANGSFGHPIL
jgi:hypothetical protein